MSFVLSLSFRLTKIITEMQNKQVREYLKNCLIYRRAAFQMPTEKYISLLEKLCGNAELFCCIIRA